MGWTAGDDPLRQIELQFPTREAALAYARRQGLAVRMPGGGAAPLAGQAHRPRVKAVPFRIEAVAANDLVSASHRAALLA